ncbi:hypothetical protein ACED16_19170 [Enterobacter hormaechei]
MVTMDALHCQTETLNRGISQLGNFIVQVKANQEKLSRHVTEAFARHYASPELAEYVEKAPVMGVRRFAG